MAKPTGKEVVPPGSPPSNSKAVPAVKPGTGLSNLRSRVTSSQFTEKQPPVQREHPPANPAPENSTQTVKNNSVGEQAKDVTNITNKMSNLNTQTDGVKASFATENVAALESKPTNLSKINSSDNAMAMVKGRGVGIPQKEPQWTDDQIRLINKAANTILQVTELTDTRTSREDEKQEYIAIADDGNPTIMPKAALGTIQPGEYAVGVGMGRYDTVGEKPRMYHDIVMIDPEVSWLSAQWLSSGVVVQGMTKEQLDGGGKAGKRRMGQDFARIGLPKFNFGPLINTLSKKYPGCLGKFKMSKGYYWVNASWGVGRGKGTFCFSEGEGQMTMENELSTVLRRLNGKSSMCDAVIAFALAQQTIDINGEKHAAHDGYEISVKLHTCIHFADVQIAGPPLPTSTGLMMSSSYVSKAKPLPKPSIMTSSTAGLKGPGAFQPLQGLTGGSTASSSTPISDFVS